MANPLWKTGMTAVNPSGRPRNSVRTVKGMVERFVKRNITPNKLQKLFNALTEKYKLNMLSELLPYILPKQSSVDGMSAADVDTLYDSIMNAIKDQHGKTG